MAKYLPRTVLKWFHEEHKIGEGKDGEKLPYKVFYSRFYFKFRRASDLGFLKEVEERVKIHKEDKEETLKRINAML